MDALNVVYDEKEKRGFIKLNLVSLAIHACRHRLGSGRDRRRGSPACSF